MACDGSRANYLKIAELICLIIRHEMLAFRNVEKIFYIINYHYVTQYFPNWSIRDVGLSLDTP